MPRTVAYQTGERKREIGRVVMQPTGHTPIVSGMAQQGASQQAVAAYLRSRVRAAVKVRGTRGFAEDAKMSHPPIVEIVKGVNALSKMDTVLKLAAAFGLSMPALYEEASRFAVENPDLVQLENASETHVEIDTVTNPTLGDLPGWKESEAELPSWIPREAIEGARRLGANEFRESGRVTPAFVRRAVDLWLEGQNAKDDRSGEE